MPLPVPPGMHTVHECKNLWDALAFQMTAMGKAVARAQKTWAAADASGWGAWLKDWETFSGAFADETAGAYRVTQLADDASTPSWDLVPAIDPEFPLLGDEFPRLTALFVTGDPTGDPGVTTPQGFNGLDARFRLGPAKAFAPSYVGIPKPDAPDLQLQAYQLTDQAMKVIEKVATFGGSAILLVGLVGVGILLATRRR